MNQKEFKGAQRDIEKMYRRILACKKQVNELENSIFETKGSMLGKQVSLMWFDGKTTVTGTIVRPITSDLDIFVAVKDGNGKFTIRTSVDCLKVVEEVADDN